MDLPQGFEVATCAMVFVADNVCGYHSAATCNVQTIADVVSAEVAFEEKGFRSGRDLADFNLR